MGTKPWTENGGRALDSDGAERDGEQFLIHPVDRPVEVRPEGVEAFGERSVLLAGGEIAL